MTDPRRVKQLFVAALDLPVGQRTDFLARECGPDADLLARVNKLLAAHDDAPTGAYVPNPDQEDDEPVGTVGQMVAGRYKLLEAIGEGGMGSVWMAEQREPVKRLVALKLIKAGMDSKAVLARFEAERQALAVMDHPNIAKVLDGGVAEDNRPFFVMELVKGVPITRFCDERKLPLRKRLELFVPVCQAIQHAHMKGVIHRDIKPSNVLVALYDDKAVPKVIDFGIAKATGQSLTDKTLHTGFGAVVGTPEYMSPEQASLNNLDIDTRSDVYSLGVLLYELLTGSPPFTKRELERAGLLEMLRVVREQEPPRPSLKVSTLSARPGVAANRGLEPDGLARQLRSELDWMVMKSLEKDRNRRYDSPNALAADVGRYLGGEQVLAVPPSLGYRLRKWVRKNRGLVITSGLVATSLTVGIVGTTWQAIRAEREAGRAIRALDQAERNLVGSYLRPIGFNAIGLDPAERIAFGELARQEDRVKLLFLREALSDGERSFRVARRAERVAQSAVGTSLARREAALRLIRDKLSDPTADRRVRLAAGLLAVQLGSDEVGSFEEHFGTLLAQAALTDWANFLDPLPQRIRPAWKEKLFEAAVTLVATRGETDHQASRIVLAMVDRVDSVTIKRNFDLLLDRFAKDSHHEWIGECLGAMVPALGPGEWEARMDRVAEQLLSFFSQPTRFGGDSWWWFGGLVTAMDPPRADRMLRVLIEEYAKGHHFLALNENVFFSLRSKLTPSLARQRTVEFVEAVIGDPVTAIGRNFLGEHAEEIFPLGSPDLAFRCFEGTLPLVPRLGVINLFGEDPNTPSISRLLNFLAERLDGEGVARATESLRRLFPSIRTEEPFRVACAALARLARRMDSGSADPCIDSLGELLARLEGVASAPVLDLFARLAERVERSRVPFLFRKLVAMGEGVIAEGLRPMIEEGLGAMALRMEGPALRSELDRLIASGAPTDARARGIEILAARIDSVGAAAAFDALLSAAGVEPSPAVLSAMTGLALRTDPPSRRERLRQVHPLTLNALSKANSRRSYRSLDESLARSVPELTETEVEATAQAVNAFLRRRPRTQDGLEGGLQIASQSAASLALASRFDAAAAERHFAALVESGRRPQLAVYWGRSLAVDPLIALAERLQPPVAARWFHAIAANLEDRDQLSGYASEIGPVLTALARRIEPSDRAAAIDRLSAAVARSAPDHDWTTVVESAAELARSGDPEIRTGAFRILLLAIEKEQTTEDSQATIASRIKDLVTAMVGKLTDETIPEAALRCCETVLVHLAESASWPGTPSIERIWIELASRVDGQVAERMADAMELARERSLAARDKTPISGVPRGPRRDDRADRDTVLDEHLLSGIFQLLPKLRPEKRDARLQRMVLHIIGENGDAASLHRIRVLYRAVAIENSIPFLTRLLADPSTVGDFQRAVLRRLESLAYPDPVEAVTVIAAAANPLTATTLPPLLRLRDDRRPESQRLRTVSDAAKWIAEHHPEIDLDRTYHLINKGE